MDKQQTIKAFFEMNMALKDSLAPNVLNKLMANLMKTNENTHLTRLEKMLLILSNYNLRGQTAVEFLKGAHFIAEDAGKLVLRLQAIPGCEKRFSSHFKGNSHQQFGLHCGKVLPELLFFATYDPNDPSQKPRASHFQIEASPWRGNSFIDFELYRHLCTNPQSLMHVPQFAIYHLQKLICTLVGAKHYNLGAYGWSSHTDQNPIQLQSMSA